MKKLVWALLAALPLQAAANEEDPIAYKCYYCTESEMEDVALAQGVGRHYVYDANDLRIVGFDVESNGGSVVARPFAAESWVSAQLKGMMALYSHHDGLMNATISDVILYAPGSDHGRQSQRMWGHHLSSLHPEHVRAREVVRRFLRTVPSLQFLNIPEAQGKLLRMEHMLGGTRPMMSTLAFYGSKHGRARFIFDHESRDWILLDAEDRLNPIQQARDDFAPLEGPHNFRHEWLYSEVTDAFMERARWASVPVHGDASQLVNGNIRCERKGDDIQCYLPQR
jgi:hypothetical protein